MDAVDGNVKSIAPRPLRYSRAEVLNIKESKEPIAQELLESIARAIAFVRGSRTRKAGETGNNDRSRDTDNIILGPQKRSWNTGCHVSQSSSKDIDSGSATGRGGKFVFDHHSTNRSESRRDYRGFGNSYRDRGNYRKNFTSFHHNQQKDGTDRGHEEEPEWFSEGPATINETIELGEILELDKPFDLGTKKESNDSSANTETEENLAIATESPPSKDLGTANISPKARDAQQGSRFKHLFTQLESEKPISSGAAIGDQLLQLLKGHQPSRQSSTARVRNNVMEVESKLRSILLGRGNNREVCVDNLKPETKTMKQPVLTVEEIESQLNLRRDDPAIKSAIGTTTIKTPTPASLNAQQNLGPILQNLLRARQQAQPPHAGLNQGNTGSVPTRINRAQHSQYDLSSSSVENSVDQSMLRQMWNSPLQNHATNKVSPLHMQRLPGAGDGIPFDDAQWTDFSQITRSSTCISTGLPMPVTKSDPKIPLNRIQPIGVYPTKSQTDQVASRSGLDQQLLEILNQQQQRIGLKLLVNQGQDINREEYKPNAIPANSFNLNQYCRPWFEDFGRSPQSEHPSRFSVPTCDAGSADMAYKAGQLMWLKTDQIYQP